jgi:SulP family sulfate permease
VLLATFLLTIFEDLLLGIATGVTLGAFLFLHRVAETVEVKNGGGFLEEDQADDYGGRRAYDVNAGTDANFMVYKISGALFFGVTANISTVLDRIGTYPHTFVFDFSEVPLIDTTAAKALEAFVSKLRRAGTQVYIAGARPGVRGTLLSSGLEEPQVQYTDTIDRARTRTPSTKDAAAETAVK